MRSMVTLFNLSMLGDDLAVVLRAAVAMQPWAAALVCLYIMIAAICLMNTIVGMIVQKTMNSWNEQRDEKELQLKECVDAVRCLASVMFELDGDNDGELSRAEFRAGFEHSDLNRLLRRIELPWGFTSDDLFNLLDTSCRGKLSKDQFTNGLFQLAFGSSFQRECRTSLLHANLHRTILEMKEDLYQELHRTREQVSIRLKYLDAHSSSAGAKGSQALEPVGNLGRDDCVASHHGSASHNEKSSMPYPPASFTYTLPCVAAAIPCTKEDESALRIQRLDQAMALLHQVRNEADKSVYAPCEIPHKLCDDPFAPTCMQRCAGNFSVPLETRLLPSFTGQDDGSSKNTSTGSFSGEAVPSASTSEVIGQAKQLQHGCRNQACGTSSSKKAEFSDNASGACDQIKLLGNALHVK